MTTKFIKSSAKVKPDPNYYLKKLDYFRRRHEEEMEKAGRNLDVQPAYEDPLVTRLIDSLGAKRMYYARMYPVAMRLKDQEAKKESK